ncbi:HAD superfamily hydrolase (TIGR01509 family) [Gelidibacter algens]|uniref:HAD superfamily hydrolase (TIGR01509 family) n=1 Tax=Gelidibacter algens TaxID=49280 RepID=A0A1A7R4X4_9FLAO|nr:HAD family hydrolase [Gelidibacter algens]OBX25812.1 HAD family hydrolase [Gelidibacter algens]RAJ19123.1 HAD superfamily hydrolase (TIGR01509 family) [Gelidibacter algens]
MSKYKCIIFDCDGVLVDSETISNQVLVEMANELGAAIDLDYALRHFKGDSIQNCHDKISELVTQALPQGFIANFRERSFDSFKKNIKAVEGIQEVLDQLSIPFCVASSGPENKIRLNLELTGLLPYFENKIFSCHEIEKWKPDPAVFLWAAKTMGFTPQECVVIEDSVTGVTAAKRGGFDVFGFTAHDYNNELEGKATVTFKTMPEVLNLLR